MTSRLVCSSVPAAVKMVAESGPVHDEGLPVHVGVHLEIPGHIEAVVSGADGGHDHA